MTSTPTDLDRLDIKILKCLQEDGRISNLKLAETVALSPTAVLARVQRLTKDGYILGYEARLNPLKLGAGRHGGLPGLCRHRVVAIARGARNTHLPGDGRSQKHDPVDAGLASQGMYQPCYIDRDCGQNRCL